MFDKIFKGKIFKCDARKSPKYGITIMTFKQRARGRVGDGENREVEEFGGEREGRGRRIERFIPEQACCAYE